MLLPPNRGVAVETPFYLEDNTGQVLVNPQGAEI